MKIGIPALVLLASVFLLSQAVFTHAGRINRSHLHDNAHRRHHHRNHHERHDLHHLRTSTRPGQQKSVMTNPDQMLFQVRRRGRQRRPDTVQIAGSRLPDCSHACGSCSPCRLVMVSFVCALLEESETCPMAYKCMCRSKSYPVP